MAPEQARGDVLVDQRADVFALGAMLAGITRGVAPMVAVARKAQAEDAAQRYQSVSGLAAEVNRYLAGRAGRTAPRAVHRSHLTRRPSQPPGDPARPDLSRGAGPAHLSVPRLRPREAAGRFRRFSVKFKDRGGDA